MVSSFNHNLEGFFLPSFHTHFICRTQNWTGSRHLFFFFLSLRMLALLFSQSSFLLRTWQWLLCLPFKDAFPARELINRSWFTTISTPFFCKEAQWLLSCRVHVTLCGCPTQRGVSYTMTCPIMTLVSLFLLGVGNNLYQCWEMGLLCVSSIISCWQLLSYLSFYVDILAAVVQELKWSLCEGFGGNYKEGDAEEWDRNENEETTAGKHLSVGSVIPSLDLADCDARVLSQHLKGIKGLKFSVTTEVLLQASAPTTCGWLLMFLCKMSGLWSQAWSQTRWPL